MDRMGGARTRLGISRGMADFVFNTGLVDGQFRGPRFTWKRGSLSQRLDRCLLNDTWLDLFSDSVVLHMDLLGSDHHPILLKAGDNGDRNAVRPFRGSADFSRGSGALIITYPPDLLHNGRELILSEPCVRRVENGVGKKLAFDRLRPLTTHPSLPPRVLLVLSMLFEIVSRLLMIVTYKALLLG
ncbi:hypothetical protein V6N13_074955 [Hibiscus sabdariffa]